MQYELPQYIKNMSLHVDGIGMAGNIEEVQLPKLKSKTDEYQGGGMDAPVDIPLGMEKLEASFTLNKYKPALFAAFGLLPGREVLVNFRAALQEGGKVVPVKAVVGGFWNEIDTGTWKANEKIGTKVQISCAYYKLYIDNVKMVEIDIPNLKREIGGLDQLRGVREALEM